MNNVIIIGAGPAGCSAAVYAGRANLAPLVFAGELSKVGGQLTTTTDVENFLGFNSIDGYQLAQRFLDHAEICSKDIIQLPITKINIETTPFSVEDSEGNLYLTKSIIIATGANAKRLGLPSETKFWNKGISACATCDGALKIFRDKPIIVVGGGDVACEEALHLSKFGSIVYILIRGPKFRASKIMIDRVSTNPKIKIMFNTEIEDVFGSDNVEGVTLHNKETMTVSGVFYGIGHTPNTSFLKNTDLDLDEHGYIQVAPGTTRTNIAGVFACGDVCDKVYRQAITSAGNGCMAALDCEKFLSCL